MNNLKQMGLATHNMNDQNGVLPCQIGPYPNLNSTYGPTPPGPNGAFTTASFEYWLLPFIEQSAAYNTLPFTNGAQYNSSWWAIYPIKTYVAPDDPRAPANGLVDSGSPRYGSSYAPNEYVFSGGNNSPKPFWSYGASWGVSPTAAIPKSFPDGTSNTIIFSTRYMVCGPTTNQVTYTWGEECQGCGGCSRIGNGAQGTAMGFYSTALPQWKPTPANCQGCLLQGLQSNGIEVCMGDGSTRLVSSGVSANSWLYAVLPNDNMTFDSTW